MRIQYIYYFLKVFLIFWNRCKRPWCYGLIEFLNNIFGPFYTGVTKKFVTDRFYMARPRILGLMPRNKWSADKKLVIVTSIVTPTTMEVRKRWRRISFGLFRRKTKREKFEFFGRSIDAEPHLPDTGWSCLPTNLPTYIPTYGWIVPLSKVIIGQ